MRGKLRDKRIDARRYSMKREQLERRRPSRRDSRTAIIIDQQSEAEGYLVEDDKEMLVVAEEAKI